MDSTSYAGEFIKTADKLNSDRKFTIAVIENYLNEASDEIKTALNLAIDKLKAFGHKIVYKNLLNSKYDIATYYIIATAEASANLSRYDGVRYGNRAKSANLKELYANTRGEGFGDEVKRRMLLGTFVLSSGYYDAYYIKAQKARAYIKAEYEEIFKEADLIFMPIAPSVAYKFGELADPLSAYLSDIYTIGVNLAGLPAISVPAGKNSGGLNISAQLIGKAYDEQAVLDGGLNLEKIIRG